MTRTNDQVAAELEAAFGISGATIKHGLSQDELFDAAIENDRGIVVDGGPSDAQKAFPTALGKEGPLVFYTDPTCTGRPTQDTFAVARPATEDQVWWKPDFQKFDATRFADGVGRFAESRYRLRQRVVVNEDEFSVRRDPGKRVEVGAEVGVRAEVIQIRDPRRALYRWARQQT